MLLRNLESLKLGFGSYHRAGILLPIISLLGVTIAPVAEGAFTTPGSFDVGPDGSANYSISIQVPPGTSGMSPKLSLSYSSNNGNGLMGVGWGLEGLSQVSRCPRTQALDGVRGGVNYDANDRYCLDGQRLLTTGGSYGADGTEYRTELANIAKIVSYGAAGNGPAWFKVWTKGGQIMEYGNTADSRIEAAGKTTVRLWGLNKISDTVGNYISATYVEDNTNGEAYISRMDYTGNSVTNLAPYASVRFTYEARPDVEIAYQAGSIIKSTKRLTNVRTYTGETVVKDYKLTFELTTAESQSRLKSLVECNGNSTSACLQQIQLTYPSFNPGSYVVTGATSPIDQCLINCGFWEAGDINNDGKTDFAHITTASSIVTWISTGAGGFNVVGATSPIDQCLTSCGIWQAGDINGDGKLDLIHITTANSIVSWISKGDGTYTVVGVTDPLDRCLINCGIWQAGDINNDGKMDLIHITTANSLVTWISKGDGTYTVVGATDPLDRCLINCGIWHVGDINNDGKLDLAHITTDSSIVSWISKGDGTYTVVGAKDPLDRCLINCGIWQPSDINGDGRLDLVHITTANSIVSWISKGDGTFTVVGVTDPLDGCLINCGFWQVADINADGNSDFIHITTANSLVSWISKGDGTYKVAGATSPIDGCLTTCGMWQVGDVNGDGKSDLIHITTASSLVSWVSIGDGTYNVIGATDPIDACLINCGIWEVGDINGDGKLDLVHITTASSIVSWQAGPINVIGRHIASIQDSYGTRATVTYKSIVDNTIYQKDSGSSAAVFPVIDLQLPTYVVSSVQAPDGIGGVLTTSYQYGGLKADLNRGSLGFRWIKTIDADSDAVVTSYYRQDYPYIGLISSSEKRRLSNNNLVSASQNTYLNSPIVSGSATSQFPYVSQSVERSYELTGELLSTTTTSSQYDSYGNVSQVSVDSGDGYIKTTANQYHNDTARWLLGRLLKSTVTTTVP